MKNLVLIGFMGVGKTKIGKIAAERLGMRFVDTDQVISDRLAMSVREIFSRLGEPAFRQAEREAIADLSAEQSLVIATGGGAVEDPVNLANLRKGGLVVCLWATPEVIYRRISRNKSRPLLKTDGDPMDRILALLEKRKPCYAQADVQIDTSHNDPELTLQSLLRYYREYEESQG